ncbi:unnamed protein product [Knipowitschia caucasica]|uniref:Uncharacterized protein n=1 Tax=Knipowitschia caucasica TaxID=637954 RepID=A0AAV2JM57_KNICA
MSFLLNKMAEHAGEAVADGIKGVFGIDDDKDKKKDKDGGFLSVFKRDKNKDKDEDDDHKGGLFSFGKDKDKGKGKDKDKDKGKGNFFPKIFNKDDDDDVGEKVPKKTGFAGLWTEQDQAGAGRPDDGACNHMSEGDLDMMSDLMQVANEQS